MPKIKTKKSAAKRLKLTGTGKVKRMKAFHGHIFTTKNAKRKRRLRQATLVDSANMANVKRLLPNTI